MKIRVFKLNWIAQRDLEFEVHEEHTEKYSLAAEAGSSRQAREGYRQWIHGYVNKDFVVASLSTTDMQLSTAICIAVDKQYQFVDKRTNIKLDQLSPSTCLLELSRAMVF